MAEKKPRERVRTSTQKTKILRTQQMNSAPAPWRKANHGHGLMVVAGDYGEYRSIVQEGCIGFDGTICTMMVCGFLRVISTEDAVESFSLHARPVVFLMHFLFWPLALYPVTLTIYALKRLLHPSNRSSFACSWSSQPSSQKGGPFYSVDFLSSSSGWRAWHVPVKKLQTRKIIYIDKIYIEHCTLTASVAIDLTEQFYF